MKRLVVYFIPKYENDWSLVRVMNEDLATVAIRPSGEIKARWINATSSAEQASWYFTDPYYQQTPLEDLPPWARTRLEEASS